MFQANIVADHMSYGARHLIGVRHEIGDGDDRNAPVCADWRRDGETQWSSIKPPATRINVECGCERKILWHRVRKLERNEDY